jgi:TolB protein
MSNRFRAAIALIACLMPTMAAAASFSGTISYAAFGSDGYMHIYSLTAGGSPQQLTSGAHNDETPEWSPDGSKIVFLRSDSNGVTVNIINADGSGLRNLSPTPGRDTLPAFTADGTQIVFTYVVSLNSCNNDTVPTTSIMTMSAIDGSDRTIIVDGTTAPTCFNVEPRHSPDGTSLVFACAPYNGGGQVCKVDGSGLKVLTNTSGIVTHDPHWSWDSKKLVVSRKDISGNVNVWTMNADGSNLFQVTHAVEPMEAGDAGWSLDDTQLVFAADNGGNGQSVPNAPAEIGIVNADGTNLTLLGIACSDVGCASRFKP